MDNKPQKILENLIKNKSEESAFNVVKKVLENVKKDFNADEVRFRLRDWEDKSVVYVPNWVIGTNLSEDYPESAQRIYFDPANSNDIDCATGLAARGARIREEESKKNKNEDLINVLKEDVDIHEKIITFEKMDKAEICNSFIQKLDKKVNKLEEGKKEWEKYLTCISTLESEKFFTSLINCSPPWNKDRNKQWEDVINCLKDRIDGIEKYKKIIKDAKDWYGNLYEDYVKYNDTRKEVKYGAAIPVLAFGKFIGVLNLHRKGENFNEEDKNLLEEYATILAVSYIQWQSEVFNTFHEKFLSVTVERNFEKIASTISNGIRYGLNYSIANDEIFPLLYIPQNKAIRETNELNNDLFKTIWKNSYQQRREPEPTERQLWIKENKIGRIPIREEGLGREVVNKFLDAVNQGKPRIIDLFEVIEDVDDPNGQGSLSARKHHIKTTGCLPLIFKDKLYGLLYLHCTKRHFFTELELNALETFGKQAAIAIHNAELAGGSYENLYGEEIVKLLLYSNNNSVDYIDRILNKWALDVWGTRGLAIADITAKTIEEISTYFNLPENFSKKYSKDYKDQEGALQSVDDYRDHFIHPFHVFCLGYYIICNNDQLMDLIKTKISNIPIQSPTEQDLEFIIKTWFVTSIYHDIGYPAEKFETLVATFFENYVGRRVNSQFDWSSVILANDNIKHINKLSDLYAEKIGENILETQHKFQKWIQHRLLEEHDHGVLSAMILFNKDLDWGENDNNMLYEAALAITLHSWRLSNEKTKDDDSKTFDLKSLQLEDFPLAFFLSFCDIAQEWGRRVLLKKGAYIPENKLYQVDMGSNIEIPDRGTFEKIKIKIKYSAKSTKIVHNGRSLRDVFDDVGNKFHLTWCNKETPIIFEIEGVSGNYSMGSFGPSGCIDLQELDNERKC